MGRGWLWSISRMAVQSKLKVNANAKKGQFVRASAALESIEEVEARKIVFV